MSKIIDPKIRPDMLGCSDNDKDDAYYNITGC